MHLLATTIKTGEAAADSPSFTINAILQAPGTLIGPQAARNTMHSRVWIPAGSRSIAGVRAAPLQTVPAVVRMRRAVVLPALPVVVAVVLGLAVAVAVVLGLAVADAGARPPDFNDRRLTTF